MTMQLIQERFDAFITRKFPLLKFRPYQREVILDIVHTYMEGKQDCYLLEAPTGSGKSIIAMVASEFLADQGHTGYVLASDIALHTQYADDINNIGLSWGIIKGVDNYMCTVNNEKFSLGECKSKGMSYEDAEDLPCFSSCGYLTSRKKAIASAVSLLTYPYALIQRNYVEKKMAERGKPAPFPARDFVVCDEGHKLLEIVQSHFSPRINDAIVKKAEKLLAFLAINKLPQPSEPLLKLKIIVQEILKHEDKEKLYQHLRRLDNLLINQLMVAEGVSSRAKSQFQDKPLPKEWRSALGYIDFLKDVHCKVEDYLTIIEKVGVDKMVKNPQGETEAVFNCLEEEYLMKKHFHDQFGFRLIMSATLGDPRAYCKSIGVKNARYQKIPSTFNYEKSPFYYYRGRKMSFAKKDENFPWMVERVTEILQTNSENGIIHSGSYEMGNRLYAALPKELQSRVLMYYGTEEKELTLREFYERPGAVIMGPSLLEGLNLVEDRSRFQVFLKVPYPNLTDRYVSAKLRYTPDWYNWKTSLAILQGVGRSIRHETDWAVTYMLDGCFSDLMKRSRSNFPQEFLDRIVVIQN